MQGAKRRLFSRKAQREGEDEERSDEEGDRERSTVGR
jgi:hypothetical protein